MLRCEVSLRFLGLFDLSSLKTAQTLLRLEVVLTALKLPKKDKYLADPA